MLSPARPAIARWLSFGLTDSLSSSRASTFLIVGQSRTALSSASTTAECQQPNGGSGRSTRSDRWVLRNWRISFHRDYLGESDNGWRSHAPWPVVHLSSSLMSRPETSIPSAATQLSTACTRSIDPGCTIILVTHSPDVASAADYQLRIRDGLLMTESNGDSIRVERPQRGTPYGTRQTVDREIPRFAG